MARFTASEKWGDGWFSDLKPIEKLIFLYLTDKCDNAGFFEINKRLDAFIIGISEQEYLDGLNVIKKCYIRSRDEKKIWLKNYLKHQKNLPLNPDNNAHKQIILFIVSNILNFEYDFNILAPKKGLFSPTSNGNVLGNGNSNGERGVGEEPFWDKTVRDFNNDFRWKEKFCRDKNLQLSILEKKMQEFISDSELKEDFKELSEVKRHFTNWYNKHSSGYNGAHKPKKNEPYV